MRKTLTALALAATVAGSGAACTDLVAGDSLVVQAVTTKSDVAAVAGTSAAGTQDGVTLTGTAGLAPCDYEKTMASDYARYQPKKVSLAFSGNACGAAFSQSGAVLALAYHDSLVRITNYFTSKGVAVIYSAPVCVRTGSGWPNGYSGLRTMEGTLAAHYRAQGKRVAYSEYAATRICPGWQYYAPYRADDGLHLSALGIPVFAAALRYEVEHTAV